jgi:hypothetical protein
MQFESSKLKHVTKKDMIVDTLIPDHYVCSNDNHEENAVTFYLHSYNLK